MAALGNTAICETLIAQHTDIPFAGTGDVKSTITFADDNTNLPPKGLYVVNTSGGNTGMTLPDGVNQGDSIEIIFYHAGGNAFTLTVANLHGAVNKTITCGPAVSGQYYKLVWMSNAIGTGWVMTARESLADAADNAVVGLPVIA